METSPNYPLPENPQSQGQTKGDKNTVRSQLESPRRDSPIASGRFQTHTQPETRQKTSQGKTHRNTPQNTGETKPNQWKPKSIVLTQSHKNILNAKNPRRTKISNAKYPTRTKNVNLDLGLFWKLPLITPFQKTPKARDKPRGTKTP